jgi:heme exporter protein D
MTHIGYILSAYAISAVVLLAMVASVVLDLTAQQRKLRALEAEGVRRRSEVSR